MKSRSIISRAICVVMLALLAPFLSAGTNIDELSSKDKRLLIDNAKYLIEENYVYPKKGKRYAKQLFSSFKKGEFDRVEDLEAFASTLTNVLQRVSNDLHFNSWLVKEDLGIPSESEIVESVYKSISQKKQRDWVAVKVKKLENNIGYFKFLDFQGSLKSKENIDAAMKLLENAEAIIFDLRPNYGGSPKRVQYLASYFFDEKVLLNTIYWRGIDSTIEFWSLDEVSGKKRPNVPLYILTDRSTPSAAEGFTYGLQARKRATVIGKPSQGAAHPGRPFDLGSGVQLFISTGRPIHPITKTNWEGVGVQPDYLVESEDTLAKAIELAGIEVERIRKEKADSFISIANKILAKTNELRTSSAPIEEVEMAFIDFIWKTLKSNDIGLLEIRELIERQDKYAQSKVAFLPFLDKYIIHLNYDKISG